MDLYPPATTLEAFPDQVRVIAIADDELVAVLNISILERNLTNRALEARFFLRPLRDPCRPHLRRCRVLTLVQSRLADLLLQHELIV